MHSVHMSQDSYRSILKNHGYNHLRTLSSTMPYTPTRSQDLTRRESRTLARTCSTAPLPNSQRSNTPSPHDTPDDTPASRTLTASARKHSQKSNNVPNNHAKTTPAPCPPLLTNEPLPSIFGSHSLSLSDDAFPSLIGYKGSGGSCSENASEGARGKLSLSSSYPNAGLSSGPNEALELSEHALRASSSSAVTTATGRIMRRREHEYGFTGWENNRFVGRRDGDGEERSNHHGVCEPVDINSKSTTSSATSLSRALSLSALPSPARPQSTSTDTAISASEPPGGEHRFLARSSLSFGSGLGSYQCCEHC